MKTTMFKLLICSTFYLFGALYCHAQEGVITVKQDEKIPQLLSLKTTLEKNNKLTNGFTIQIYSGERSKAYTIINKYRGLFENWPATIEYETPNYKVWVGNYSTRLDADRALLAIQEKFPYAFIFKPGRKN